MAGIQMWTPMVQQDTSGIERAGASLGRGLEGIADRLEKRKEEQKREQTNAKAALTLFKAYPELQKAIGIDEHTFTGMPRLEQIATVQGGITALSLMQANARAMREKSQYERETAGGAALARAAGEHSRGVMENYYENPEQFSSPPTFEQGLFNNPEAVNAPNFNEFSRAVQGGRAAGAQPRGPKVPESRKIGGRDVVFSPDTGAFQVLPEQVEDSGAQEIFDGEGNLIGHNISTGSGRSVFRPIKAAASGELLPVLDPVTKKPVSGFGMDASGKVHDFRSDAQKRLSGTFLDKSGEAAPAGAKPRRWNPKTKTLEPAE